MDLRELKQIADVRLITVPAQPQSYVQKCHLICANVCLTSIKCSLCPEGECNPKTVVNNLSAHHISITSPSMLFTPSMCLWNSTLMM